MDELAVAGVSAADARTLVENVDLLRIYRDARVQGARAAQAIVNEVARVKKENAIHRDFSPAWIAEVFALQDAGTISSTAAKEVFGESLRSGKPPKAIVEAKGLAQVSDSGELEKVVDAVLARNPCEVEKYKGGKKNLLGFFVGQAMRDLKGKGNPGVLNGLFKKKLGD